MTGNCNLLTSSTIHLFVEKGSLRMFLRVSLVVVVVVGLFLVLLGTKYMIIIMHDVSLLLLH